eukprot:superscaffoldBa00003311_g16619
MDDKRFILEVENHKILYDITAAMTAPVEVKLNLDHPPDFLEIEKAITQLRPGKSPGSGGIPAEVVQQGGDPVGDGLESLFTSCWECQIIPQDLRDANLHEDQLEQVKLAGSLSDSFPISNGVKQRCVLAPTLSSIFFSMMLHEAKEKIAKDNTADGTYNRFRTDGSILNLQHLFVKTKILEQLVLVLLFMDDCALIVHTKEALQSIVHSFAKAAKAFALTISLKKTEVMYQPPPGEPYSPLHIPIDDTKFNTLEHFTYLGSIMSNDATTSKDLDNYQKTTICAPP